MAAKKYPKLEDLKPEESWYQAAARIVARERVPLRVATEMLEIGLTSNEAEDIYKSDTFQKIVRTERMLFFRELYNTPGRDKAAAVGLLYLLAERLIEEGELDKAANIVDKIMKAEGWTGQEGQVNVFAGLNAKQYAEIQRELEKDSPKGVLGPDEISN